MCAWLCVKGIRYRRGGGSGLQSGSGVPMPCGVAQPVVTHGTLALHEGL